MCHYFHILLNVYSLFLPTTGNSGNLHSWNGIEKVSTTFSFNPTGLSVWLILHVLSIRTVYATEGPVKKWYKPSVLYKRFMQISTNNRVRYITKCHSCKGMIFSWLERRELQKIVRGVLSMWMICVLLRFLAKSAITSDWSRKISRLIRCKKLLNVSKNPSSIQLLLSNTWCNFRRIITRCKSKRVSNAELYPRTRTCTPDLALFFTAGTWLWESRRVCSVLIVAKCFSLIDLPWDVHFYLFYIYTYSAYVSLICLVIWGKEPSSFLKSSSANKKLRDLVVETHLNTASPSTSPSLTPWWIHSV